MKRVGSHESPHVITYALVLSISCSTWDFFYLFNFKKHSRAVPLRGQQPPRARNRIESTLLWQRCQQQLNAIRLDLLPPSCIRSSSVHLIRWRSRCAVGKVKVEGTHAVKRRGSFLRAFWCLLKPGGTAGAAKTSRLSRSFTQQCFDLSRTRRGSWNNGFPPTPDVCCGGILPWFEVHLNVVLFPSFTIHFFFTLQSHGTTVQLTYTSSSCFEKIPSYNQWRGKNINSRTPLMAGH